MLQTLLLAVGLRWWQAACVWCFHSQWWCILGRGHRGPRSPARWASGTWHWQCLDTLLGC